MKDLYEKYGGIVILIVSLLFLCVMLLSSCSTPKVVTRETRVEVPVYLHEIDTHYVEVSKEVYIHDTLMIVDSIISYVDANGVAHADRTHNEYRSKNLVDRSETDSSSVRVEDRPVEIVTTDSITNEVEKKVYLWWPSVLILAAFGAVVLLWFYYSKKKS